MNKVEYIAFGVKVPRDIDWYDVLDGNHRELIYFGADEYDMSHGVIGSYIKTIDSESGEFIDLSKLIDLPNKACILADIRVFYPKANLEDIKLYLVPSYR